MKDITKRLKCHFDQLRNRMPVFCQHGVQVEGWLKGEMLFALEHLKDNGIINNFDREKKNGNQRIDINISKNEESHWVELKFWLIGKQQGKPYSAEFSFEKRGRNGIIDDVEKLSKIRDHTEKWLLILCASNPGKVAWTDGVSAFNHKFTTFRITAMNSPTEYSESYFLGLLKGEKNRPNRSIANKLQIT